jgi:hypothetical protein
MLPKNKAIVQFCFPAVFTTMSEGHTVCNPCLHLDNTYGVINVKNCLISLTAKY